MISASRSLFYPRLTRALAVVGVHAHISKSIGADMGIRVGIHSGSVTAGVLMGARCRFQLFGGTLEVSVVRDAPDAATPPAQTP